MSKNRGIANIQTYEELEASLRMVQNQIATNKVTQQVHGLMSGQLPTVSWNNVALFALRLIKQRLSR